MTADSSTTTPEQIVFEHASTGRALERTLSRGIKVSTIVDIGASNGMWTQMARQYLPNAHSLLIEAQPVHAEALEAYCSQDTLSEYRLAAASHSDGGEVYFDDSSAFGGLASDQPTKHAQTRVPSISIDAEVERRELSGPFLLKLDTHGYEIPILNGATKVLKHTQVAVIETYNFQIAEGSLLFHEMCADMERRGFRVADFSEPMWRPYDKSFWQMDIVFTRSDRPEFSHNAYQ